MIIYEDWCGLTMIWRMIIYNDDVVDGAHAQDDYHTMWIYVIYILYVNIWNIYNLCKYMDRQQK